MSWPTNPGNKKAVVTYGQAHRRVYRDRGSASGYACVDCGGEAAEWTYDNADPDELSELMAGKPIRYSLKPEHYAPRCRPCHKTFDNAHRPPRTHCRKGHELTPENTTPSPDSRCRTCKRIRERKRKRAMAALREPRPRRLRALATHCKRGHEFTPENTYRKPSTPGRTQLCKTCSRIVQQAYRATRRQLEGAQS